MQPNRPTPVPPLEEQLRQLATQHLKAQALNDALTVGSTMLAGGLVLRGGLEYLRRARQKDKEEKEVMHSFTVPVPVPVKKAGFWAGDEASIKEGIPWYYPAVSLAAIGGGLLGWNAADYFFKNKRKKDRKEELEKAKQDFESALVSLYDTPRRSALTLRLEENANQPAAVKVSHVLDRLWNNVEPALEKMAVSMADVAGQLAGSYGVYAGLSSLLAGALVYNQIKKRSPEVTVGNAISKLNINRHAHRPAELSAVPVPVVVEDEEENEKKQS